MGREEKEDGERREGGRKKGRGDIEVCVEKQEHRKKNGEREREREREGDR